MTTQITITPETGGATIEMPCGFKYKPYTPKKRIKVTQTSRGSFSQKSLPLFLYGNDYLDWEIEAVTRDFAEQIYQIYVLIGKLIFTGAWGENYLVEFSEFERIPKAGFFELKGKFRIVCIYSHFDTSCET